MSKRNTRNANATPANNVNATNDTQSRIDALLTQLRTLQSRDDSKSHDVQKQCKRIRRALRAMNHAGATRVRSSIYFDATRNVVNDEMWELRRKRLIERAQSRV